MEAAELVTQNAKERGFFKKTQPVLAPIPNHTTLILAMQIASPAPYRSENYRQRTLTVPFSYDEVRELLSNAQTRSTILDFKQSNFDNLRASLSNGPRG